MNCKTGDVLYIDETKQGNTLAYRKFCKILNGQTDFPIEGKSSNGVFQFFNNLRSNNVQPIFLQSNIHEL